MLARYLSISSTNFCNAKYINNGYGIYRTIMVYLKQRYTMKSIDLAGKVFADWTVLERLGKAPSGNFKWLCRCKCGREFEVDGNNLKRGTSTCCRHCAPSKSKGKYSGDPIKTILIGMKQRCYYPKHVKYKYYGGSGIFICNEWLKNSESFYDWAYANGYSKGLSIDRIDNSKGYSPNNCRFIERKDQAKNRRTNYSITIGGITDTLAGWCREKNLNYDAIKYRIYRGATPLEALDIT